MPIRYIIAYNTIASNRRVYGSNRGNNPEVTLWVSRYDLPVYRRRVTTSKYILTYLLLSIYNSVTTIN